MYRGWKFFERVDVFSLQNCTNILFLNWERKLMQRVDVFFSAFFQLSHPRVEEKGCQEVLRMALIWPFLQIHMKYTVTVKYEYILYCTHDKLYKTKV